MLYPDEQPFTDEAPESVTEPTGTAEPIRAEKAKPAPKAKAKPQSATSADYSILLDPPNSTFTVLVGEKDMESAKAKCLANPALILIVGRALRPEVTWK